MKLMKVQFTEWRDPPQKATRAAPTELETLNASLAELASKEVELRSDLDRMEVRRKIADTPDLRAQHLAVITEMDNLVATRRATIAAQNTLGAQGVAAMKAAAAGRFGYQVLNDEGTECLKVVDENGADLPDGAVYGYEIIDQAPPRPLWAPAEPIPELTPDPRFED